MNDQWYIITKKEAGERIDKLLVSLNKEYSRSEIQSWITSNYVAVNGKNVKRNYKCRVGDMITWTVPENKRQTIVPENIPLSIVYEDHHLLVVNKPRGMVVHPAAGHSNGTLVNALLYHIDHLSSVNGDDRPGIVHRLDKDTSGLLMVAKDDTTHVALAKQLKANETYRQYEAIVHGVVDHDSGMIDAPIARDPNNRKRMAVVDGGKHALTRFQVLQRFEQFTHVSCRLETGRTHQIRVHMAYIGHPLVGDPKYGRRKTFAIDGQALHARSLGFTHPATNKWMQFETSPPAYFSDLLEKLKRSIDK